MSNIPELTICEKATHTGKAVCRTDVAPSVSDTVLTVHRVTSPSEGGGRDWHPTTVRSVVCRVADDLVIVEVQGWSWRNRVGGIYAFTPGPTGWKKVNVTAKVIARIIAQAGEINSPFGPAARLAMGAVISRDALEAASELRKRGINAYVDPDDPQTVLRFSASTIRVVSSQRFTSLAAMIRAARDLQQITDGAGGMVVGERSAEA